VIVVTVSRCGVHSSGTQIVHRSRHPLPGITLAGTTGQMPVTNFGSWRGPGSVPVVLIYADHVGLANEPGRLLA
jgi:hypothetical protein